MIRKWLQITPQTYRKVASSRPGYYSIFDPLVTVNKQLEIVEEFFQKKFGLPQTNLL
jgi:hypothetical protein